MKFVYFSYWIGKAPTPFKSNLTAIREQMRCRIDLLSNCLHGTAAVYLAHYCKPTSINAGPSHLRSANLCQWQHKQLGLGFIRKLEMWANAQRDGRPAYYRWRPLFNASVWLTPTIRVPCSNAAKTRNPLKFAGVPQTRQQISAVSRPKFTILSGYVEDVLLLNKFFSDCRYMP